MSQRQKRPSLTTRTTGSLSGIARGRLLIGALVAAAGLVLALQWVRLPAARLPLDERREPEPVVRRTRATGD
jgi:hypothetical protein